MYYKLYLWILAAHFVFMLLAGFTGLLNQIARAHGLDSAMGMYVYVSFLSGAYAVVSLLRIYIN